MRAPGFWQSHNWRSNLLRPVAALYGIGAWIDRRFTTPQRAPLPVISIGNVTAGGAGKTPTALALLPLLTQLGHTPHIISRGYGGAKLKGHRVSLQDDWRQVGDEPLMLATHAPVWAGASRVASAGAAKMAGATLVVADDAHQHYALARDISLLVIDGARGIGNGQLLPAGPLREPFAAALNRCDAVVLIGDDQHNIAARINKTIFGAHFSSVDDIAWATDKKILAFAGIAYPQKFYDSLRRLGAILAETQDFPDHHPYTREEIEALIERAQHAGATLATTAKDIVKIPEDLRPKIHVLHVALQWDDEAALLQWLREKLAALS